MYRLKGVRLLLLTVLSLLSRLVESIEEAKLQFRCFAIVLFLTALPPIPALLQGVPFIRYNKWLDML